MSLREKFDFKEEPIYVMDGNAFVFRGYFANSKMARSDSFPTGAMYIVGRTLMKILREEKPKYFLFVLDGQGPHFRHELFPEYKAQRPSAPDDLKAQFDPIKRMLGRLGIRVEVSCGCEADDYIASIAKKHSEERPVVIIGMDKDLRQCLNKNVIMWDPASKEEKIVTEESFRESTGLAPSQWADVQALIGDTSDNIPGVRGIGEKTAMKLFQDFPSLEAIRDNYENLPLPIKKKMEGNLDAMFLYRKLTTLNTEKCQEIDLEAMTIQEAHEQNALAFFKEFELHALAKEFDVLVRKKIIHIEEDSAMQGSFLNGENTQGNTAQNDTDPVDIIEVPPIEINFVENLPDCTGMALAIITQNTRTEEGIYIALAPLPKPLEFLRDVARSEKENKQVVPETATKNDAKPQKTSAPKNPHQQSLFTLIEQDTSPAPKILNMVEEAAKILALPTGGKRDILYKGDFANLIPYMQNAAHIVLCDLKKIMHENPRLADSFKNYQRFFDLSLGAWLLSPDEKDYGWIALSNRHALEARMTTSHPAHLAISLYEQTIRHMEGRSLLSLMLEMEMPLVPVLYEIEKIGIQVNVGALFSFLDEVRVELESLTNRIYAEAGGEFNIRSAQQIGEILFKKLDLPMKKSTKGGQASTSHEVLEQLSGTHPVIDALQEYRKLEKLRSTYLEPLPRMTGKDGRIHTTLNQFATGTGRLSSSNPNLQNIPVRGKIGKRMRTCFTAKPGYFLVSADYSQVELRVLAHCSGDETLREAFLNNEDIHSRTAALLYDASLDAVTPDMRRHAKTINFGLLYGMGVRKLAQDLHITNQEAKRFMEVYFSRFHQIKAFYDEVENFAREHAYVTTLAGRQRALPDIMSSNHQAKALAERQAVNTLIQGTAADIIKLAMLAVHKDTLLKELGARLLLQIHDELILEVPENNAEQAGKRMAEIMMNIAPGGKRLSVPLLVDYGIGLDWGGAH